MEFHSLFYILQLLTVQNEADDSKKIYTEDLIPLVVITDKTINSFVKDYHAHKDL